VAVKKIERQSIFGEVSSPLVDFRREVRLMRSLLLGSVINFSLSLNLSLTVTAN
jgi:hypothetical protein